MTQIENATDEERITLWEIYGQGRRRCGFCIHVEKEIREYPCDGCFFGFEKKNFSPSIEAINVFLETSDE